MSIYSIFYEKLPSCKADVLPCVKGKIVTCLNPYYIEKLKRMSGLYERFDYICSDGILPIWLNRLYGGRRTERISFDMTSLAKYVFEYCSANGIGIYFVGAKEEEMGRFVKIISESYPDLGIRGWHHGYIKDQFDNVTDAVIRSGAGVAVIGMGAPMQDEFALHLLHRDFTGTVYTCGGFFHQTTERLNYYPAWINRWHLRTLYRLFHERYVWGRLFRYYPGFVIHYSWFLWKQRRIKETEQK